MEEDRDIDSELTRLKQALHVLIKEYEKFFSEVRSKEPLSERNKLNRDLGKLKCRQTRQHYLLGQIRQSFSAYSQLWDREILKRLRR